MEDTLQFDNLEIRGFRGIASLRLNGLGILNVLLGANDVGKTSILEAILLVCTLSEPRSAIRLQNGRSLGVQKIDDLLSVFSELDFNTTIEIYACRHRDAYRKLLITAPSIDVSDLQKSTLTERGPSVGAVRGPTSKPVNGQTRLFVSGSRMLQYDVEVKPGNHEAPLSFSVRLVDFGEKWGLDLGDSNTTPGYLSIPVSLLGATESYDPERIGKVVIGKRDERMMEFLRIINPRVARLSVLGETVYLDIGLSKMMPLNMFGSGMIRAAVILSECILRETRILLIDELEYGLHYRAIPALVETLITLAHESGIQVFVTTHSIDVLRGFQQVLQREEFRERRASTTCFAMQRNDGGDLRAYRYDYEQFDHCIRNEMEIR